MTIDQASAENDATDGSGTVVWFEIYSGDTKSAREFYGEMFGWQFEPFSEFSDDYWFIRGVGGVGGGLAGAEGQRERNGLSSVVYVQVSDLSAAIDKARSMGATLERDVTAIGEDGVFAMIRDLDGNAVGLWSAV